MTEEDYVNVTCVLTNDPVQTLSLTYSSLADKKIQPVEEAEVSVSYEAADSYGTVTESGEIAFLKSKAGVWTAEFTPIVGAVYNLSVKVPGREPMTAATRMPSSIYAHYIPFGAVNCPMERHFVYQVNADNPCTFWIYGMDYNPTMYTHEIAELIYTDNNYHDGFNVTKIRKGDVPEFQDPEYKSLDTPAGSVVTPQYYAQQDGRFDSRDFMMYSRFLRVEYPDLPLEEMVVTPYDELDVPGGCLRKSFNVMANFEPQYFNRPHYKSYMMFVSVSEEYDTFLKEMLFIYEESFLHNPAKDLTHLYPEVYTNIVNGRGIFGAEWRNEPIYMRSYYDPKD